MDLKIYDPQNLTATAEDFAKIDKELLVQIAKEYHEFDHKVNKYPYISVTTKGGGKERDGNSSWNSLLNIVNLNYSFKVNGKTVDKQPGAKKEVIVGELKNALQDKPIELEPIEKEAEEKCCENPEDCAKPECKTIDIDELGKEDLQTLLTERGVEFKKTLGVKKLRILLKDTENK